MPAPGTAGGPSNGFARRLQHSLKEREINGAQLALRLNVSANTVSNWVTGAHEPKSFRLPEIARALDTSVGDLLGVNPPESHPPSKTGKRRLTESDGLVRRLAALKLESAAAKFADSAPDLLEVLRQAENLSRRLGEDDS